MSEGEWAGDIWNSKNWESRQIEAPSFPTVAIVNNTTA